MKLRRPISLLRVPGQFWSDHATLSASALAVFFRCISNLADDREYRSFARHELLAVRRHARHLGLGRKRTAAVIAELTAHGLVVERGGEVHIADADRWFAKKKPARKSLPRAEVVARDGYRCVYCEKSVSLQTAHVDHVIPKSRGGSDNIDNLVTACGPCNTRKSAKTPEEWLQ